MIHVRRQIYLLLVVSIACTVRPALSATIPPTVVVDSLQLLPSSLSQIGLVEVSIDTPDPTTIPIAGFQINMSLVGPDDSVKFLDVLAPQSHTYVFAPSSTAPFSTIAANGREVTFGDFLDTGFAQATDGTGLGAIRFVVQPEAAGKTYELVINLDPSESFLASDATTFVTFMAQNGRISVSLVPEPTVSILAFVALGFCAVCHRSRKTTLDPHCY